MDSIIFQRIKNLCVEHGITVTKLESLMGYSQSSIGKWKAAVPTVDKLVKVAQYFNVSVDYLVGMTAYTQRKTQNLTVEEIGLSEQTTKNLIELSKSDTPFDAKKMSTINLLLEDDAIEERGSQLLQSIADCLFAPEIPKRRIQFTADEIKVISDDSSLFDNPQTYSEYANVLCDRLLIDRVIRAIESAKYQHQHPEPMGKI